MSNYPPGVTGNEYEINGPDREYSALRPCASCGRDTLHDVAEWGLSWWAECVWCGTEDAGDLDIEPSDDGPDDREQLRIERFRD